MDLGECECSRVVKLVLPESGRTFWICTSCNAQYIPKKAVDYKIESLTGTLMKLIEEGVISFEQVAGVWPEESLQV